MNILKRTFLMKIQDFRLNKILFALLMIAINELKILLLQIKLVINN